MLHIPDDEAVGMAGTLVKYKNEKKKLIKIVFSKGQSSHPHLKEEIIVEERKQETKKVDSILNIKHTYFLNLTDTKLLKEIEEQDIKTKLKEIIKKHKPSKVFIPTKVDPHPDHRAVNKAILETLETMKISPDVYSFDVWNITKRQLPKLYIDITPHFKQKLKIMQKFKSQKLSMYLLTIPVYLRARLYGRKIKTRYAERFYRIR